MVGVLKKLYNFAERTGQWTGANPAKGIQFYHEPRRTRFIQPNELPQLWTALNRSKNPDLRDFVNLALWTGARKTDVLSMRWQDVSLDDNRWNIPDPKNRTPYAVPLTPEAIAILKARQTTRDENRPWVFPATRPNKTGHLQDVKGAWKKLLKEAKLENADLRVHDLRRTQGSFQAAQGSSLLVIGKSLGHRSLTATQIYSQINLDPVRQSMETANATMKALTRKKPKLLPAVRSQKAVARRGRG